MAENLLIVGSDGDQWVGYYWQEGARCRRLTGPTREQIVHAVPACDCVEIVQQNSEAVPCAVASNKAGCVAPISQANPCDHMDAWVRVCVDGVLADDRHWDGVIVVLRNGRSHWIHVSADEIISFQTTLTPRLITLFGAVGKLSQQVFSDCLSRPERLVTELSRAEHSGDGAAVLGCLLGAELAALRPYWLGREVVVVRANGDPDYGTALASQGVVTRAVEADQAIEIALRQMAQRGSA